MLEGQVLKEFSIEGFVGHLAVVAAEMALAEHEALERGALIIETEAKDEFGTYQDQAGQFQAWAELAESTKSDRVNQGYSDDEPLLRRGDTRDSIEHKVIGREAHIGSDSQVLELLELGTSKMPPRSTLGGAAFRKTDEVVKEIGSGVVATLVGEEVLGGRLPIT